MSTKGIIDRVLPWAQGWNRDSGGKNLLKVMEQCLDTLYDFDHENMIYRGTDNDGFPPYLITTASTFRYDISAANLSCGEITRTIGGTTMTLVARKVKQVFIDVSNGSILTGLQWLGAPFLYQDRMYVQPVRGNSQPGGEGTAPYFEFKEDPESTTDRYFVEFFIGPPRMLSQSIKAPIPYGFEPAVECYMRGYVKRLESGQSNDDERKFEEYWIPRWQDYWEGVANASDTQTQLRRC